MHSQVKVWIHVNLRFSVLADDLAIHGRRLMLQALNETYNVALKITDRGGRTFNARRIRKMKKYLKRAMFKHGWPTGYRTITDRFRGDIRFRTELEKTWMERRKH